MDPDGKNTGLFEPFREICGDRHETVRRQKNETGQKAIGYLCSYVPVEILHAAGFFPVRVGEGFHPGAGANRLLPSFVCPYLRSIMELCLGGKYDCLDGLVHAYTCDAACGLFNIWRRNFPPLFAHIVHQPYLDDPEAIKFYHRELTSP